MHGDWTIKTYLLIIKMLIYDRFRISQSYSVVRHFEILFTQTALTWSILYDI